MPTRIDILNEEIFVEDFGSFPVQIFVEISDEETAFTFHMTVWDGNTKRTPNGTLCEFQVPFVATNPIDGGLILIPATKYGICVTLKYGWFTIAKGIDDYNLWTEMHPDSSIGERISAVATKFKHDSHQFREKAGVTLKDCLTLGMLSGGNPGPDQ